jgi:S-(hydroxymethyl)glutathione dehydrogenase / alcohol dehydrogenase
MRAAVLHESPGPLAIEDVELGATGPREVRVQTVATGLCHSDLHYMDGSSVTATPVVLGHEGAGIVTAVGADVTHVKKGDHVIGFPIAFCGTCAFCLAGRPTLCAQIGLQRGPGEPPRLRLAGGEPALQFVGLATFAEELLVHENSLVKIDREMPLDVACLIGCGVTTGLGAVLHTAKVPAGSTVAVIGCGGIGLNCVQGAVIAGASRIIAIDTNPGKLARAETFGATDLIDSTKVDPVAQVCELVDDLGVDYSFEAVGNPLTYELAFAVLRRGGTATVTGVMHPESKIELTGLDFLTEKKIQGSRMGSVRFREDIPSFIDLYQAGRLKLDELISFRIPLDEINEGYERIGDADVARTVVVF